MVLGDRYVYFRALVTYSSVGLVKKPDLSSGARGPVLSLHLVTLLEITSS